MRVWRRSGSRRHWIALVAAYGLLIQALVAAFAIGASADSYRAADALAVLCAHPGSATPASDGAPAAPHVPDCCLTGCSLFGATLLPAPQAAALPLPSLAESRPLPPEPVFPAASIRRGSPANPRAPPLTV